MPRTSRRLKEISFNLRIDPALKAASTAATEAEDKPVAQVLRDLRTHVERRERRVLEADARRQSLEAAKLARDPNSDKHAVIGEIKAELADESFWNE
ncbi:MAG: hypothetical protein WAV18_08075 [Roseiarcus sp.]